MPPNNPPLGTSDGIKVMPKPESMPNPSLIPPSARPNFSPPVPIQPKKKGKFGLIIFIVFILILGGAGAYAYLTDMLPPAVYSLFSKPPYSESNLVSGIVKKIADIHSSTYTLATSLYIEPRAADAEPFTIKMTDDLGLKEKYMRDYNRAQDVSRLWSALGKSVYDKASGKYQTSYPDSLATLAKNNNQSSYALSIKDPLTNKEYEYSVAPDKKDFKLTVTFETPEAIRTVNDIARYGISTTTKATTINGKTVTFTKDSYAYSLYLSQKPPQNFFQSLSDMAQYLPPEMDVKGSITAASTINPDNIAEWKFNIDGSGDMGDLTYKINVDALKKGSDYYLKVNNIPSFFLALIPSKGDWYKVSPKNNATSSEGNYGSIISDGLSTAEKDYAEKKKQAIDFIQKVASTADEEGLFHLKNPSLREKVGERKLYRYDLEVRKEALVPFYKKIVGYANSQNNLGKSFLADDGLLNYLESKEFSDVFDYYVRNTTTTLWVDDQGFPAKVEYSIRIVPDDDAVGLKGKQVVLKISLALNGINEPIVIDAPTGAKDLESVIGKSLSSARGKARSAAIKASIASIVPQAVTIADKNNDSYGTKAFPLGPCKPVSGTLFADKMISDAINTINNTSSSTALCVSTIKDGKVASFAISSVLPDDPDYSYCIDSATFSGQEILGKLKGTSCR